MIGKLSINQHWRPLARLLIVLFLAMPMAGCNLLSAMPDGGGDQQDQDKLKPQPDPGPLPPPVPPVPPEPPKPVEPVEPTEADYWNAFADLVEAGRFTNTDQIVLVAKSQQKLGHLKDIGRISEYEAKRSDITDANKSFIANKIRGG